MANPTTNYGFVLPTPSDLVTDLPADFDVALQGVDTRLKALQPGTTAGDLAYSSATANTNVRLGIGTAGQVLGITAGVPAWTTPAAGGAYTLLQTATPSAASTITFSAISGSYKHLVLVWRNCIQSPVASGQTWGLRINNDSGSNYSFYASGFSNANELTQTTTQIGSTNASAGFFSNMTDNISNVNALGFGSAIIYDYTATTNHQVEWRSFGTAQGFQNSAASGIGSHADTAAITRLDIVRLGGTQTITGNVQLYGVS